jgi:hypothetical protein
VENFVRKNYIYDMKWGARALGIFFTICFYKSNIDFKFLYFYDMDPNTYRHRDEYHST